MDIYIYMYIYIHVCTQQAEAKRWDADEAVTIDGVKMATEEPFKTANEMAPCSDGSQGSQGSLKVSMLQKG